MRFTSPLAALLVVGCLVASPDAVAGCTPRPCGCPSDTGLVIVDEAFDLDCDGTLRSRDIQCAIDCLDGDPTPNYAGPTGALAPRPIWSGVLELRAGRLPYVVDAPLHLPVGARGQVMVRGNGAVLTEALVPDEGFGVLAMFDRQLPDGVNTRDVEWSLHLTDRWTFDHVVFSGHAGTSSRVAAIAIDASSTCIVTGCRFESMPRGVVLNGARNPVVEDSLFADGTLSDVYVGALSPCSGDWQAIGPCWWPNGAGAGIVWPSGMPPHLPSCTISPGTCVMFESAGATIRNTRHLRHATTKGPVIGFQEVHLASVDGASFGGARPSSCIERIGMSRESHCLIRGCILDLDSPVGGGRPATPLIRNRAGGMFVLDATSLPDDGPEFLYDSRFAPGPTMTIFKNLASFPVSCGLASVPWTDQAFRFVDVPVIPPPDDAARWLYRVGMDWLPGAEPPERLTIDAPDLRRLPTQIGQTEVHSGMLWFDSAASALEAHATDPAGVLCPADHHLATWP